MQEKRYCGMEPMLTLTQQEYDAAIASVKEEGYQMGQQYKERYERLQKAIPAIIDILKIITE